MFNKRKPEMTSPPQTQIREIPKSIAASVTPDRPKYDGQVVIGRGTKIIGEIQDCAVVEIQGAVEGSVSAKSLVILEGGQVQGQIAAESAEVRGTFSGTLKIENLLDVKSTGRVEGDLAYGKLAVAMGGNVVGNVTNPVTGSADAAPVARPEGEPSVSDLRAYRQVR